MRKETKAIAYDMCIHPISIFTTIKLMLKGHRIGIVYGRKHGKGIRATIKHL